jgi:hypothetical protein
MAMPLRRAQARSQGTTLAWTGNSKLSLDFDLKGANALLRRSGEGCAMLREGADPVGPQNMRLEASEGCAA